MYRLNKTVSIDESGRKVVLYGIESDNQKFMCLSSDEESVKRMCDLCNRFSLPEDQLVYVVEDFIVMSKQL